MNKLILLIFWALAVPAFSQQRIYVNPVATGNNTGVSWNNAYTDLPNALQQAVNGDEVWIAMGTYRPTTSTDRTISFEPKSGVKLYGGFAGLENSIYERDWVNNETILSGDIGIPEVADDNSYNVVYWSYPVVGSLIDGCTIRDGNANVANISNLSTNRKVCGGGVYVMGDGGEAYAFFKNCRFTHNLAKAYGGGVAAIGFLEGSSVAANFKSCVFDYNNSLNFGGSVAILGGCNYEFEDDVDDCKFLYNTAKNSAGIYLFRYSGLDNYTVSNSVFDHNYGTGVSCLLFRYNSENGGFIDVHNCGFTNNTRGALFILSPPYYELFTNVKLSDCYFYDNRSYGVMFDIDLTGATKQQVDINNLVFDSDTIGVSILSLSGNIAKCEINNCNIDNIRADSTIKIKNYFSISTDSVQITKCVFHSGDPLGNYLNLAVNHTIISQCMFYGNGLANEFPFISSSLHYLYPYSVSTLVKCCVFDAVNLPGHKNYILYQDTSLPYYNGSTVVLKNSIINHTKLGDKVIRARSVSLEHNYFRSLNESTLPANHSYANNIIGINPYLADTANHDYHLLPCSPLINAGDSTGIVPGATDLDGNPRIRGGNIDIGPYEAVPLEISGAPFIKPACAGVNNGSIAFEVSYCGPLVYTWTGPGGTTGSSLTGLAAGDYVLSISNGQGSEIQFNFTIPELSVPEVNFLKTAVFCGTTTGGSAKLLPSGGTPPYHYLWEDGATDSIRNGLHYGWYHVQIIDNKGCIAQDSVSIGRVGNLAIAIEKHPPTCFGDTDGSVMVLPTNGAQPYTYTWADGSSGTSLTNLPAGIYTGTLTDVLGCGINWTIPLEEPAALSIDGADLQPATDTFATDGSIILSIAGGTPPYQALWDNGETGIALDSVKAGTYAVTITDNNGCTTTGIYELDFTVGTGNIPSPIFQLHPNPVTDMLYLSMPEYCHYVIDLLDITGRRVGQWAFTGDQLEMDMGALPAGCYWLRQGGKVCKVFKL